MRTLVLFFTALVISTCAIAQEQIVNLLAQSSEGKTVKLVWFFNSVKQDVSGFDIKRKDGLGEWQKLNTAPIMPGISLKKDLTPTGPDNIEASRIKEKLKDLLKSGILQEYNYSSFMAKWKAGDKAIMDIFSLAELDFDVSLISGFGYVDRTVTQKTDYQYGLFEQGTNKLLAQVNWNYGEIPDLNVVQEITSRVVPGSGRGIQLMWTADMAKMKAGYVAGFNIYKRGIRLNDRPIIATEGKDPSVFMWVDKAASTSVTDQYSISAESLFGIEGIIKSYKFNPSEHPAEYKRPLITNLSSQGYYFKDGTVMQWSFPAEYERYIRGFFVEKDNIPAGYTIVSDLLHPSTRSFLDHTGSQANYYIRARVVALYNDRSMIYGTERLFNYFPSTEAPKPQNTTIKATTENKRSILIISWDPPVNGDNTTYQYRLYQYDALNDKYVLLADKLPVSTNSYKYTGNGTNFKFYVAAVNRSGSESIPGDIVTWQMPLEQPQKK